MSGGKLFHAAGPATQNARLPRRRLVRGTTRSPRAAERRAARVETVVTGTHISPVRNLVPCAIRVCVCELQSATIFTLLVSSREELNSFRLQRTSTQSRRRDDDERTPVDSRGHRDARLSAAQADVRPSSTCRDTIAASYRPCLYSQTCCDQPLLI